MLVRFEKVAPKLSRIPSNVPQHLWTTPVAHFLKSAVRVLNFL